MIRSVPPQGKPGNPVRRIWRDFCLFYGLWRRQGLPRVVAARNGARDALDKHREGDEWIPF